MSICLYGCGGHGKVILDILHRQNKKVVAIVDDNPPVTITEIHDISVYQTDIFFTKFQANDNEWIVSVGNNHIREKIVEKLTNFGCLFTNAIHPSAQIALGVEIGLGTVVMANTVVNTDTYIGNHVIINTGAIVDHDCYIDDYCHIAPGCSICGQVKLGRGVLLGVGSSVKPLIEIGTNSICGAGSTVVKSIPSNCLAYGLPAKIIKYFDQQDG